MKRHPGIDIACTSWKMSEEKYTQIPALAYKNVLTKYSF